MKRHLLENASKGRMIERLGLYLAVIRALRLNLTGGGGDGVEYVCNNI